MSTKNTAGNDELSTTINGRKYTYIQKPMGETMERITTLAEELGYKVLIVTIQEKEYFFIHTDTSEPMCYFENGQPAFAPQDLLIQGACDNNRNREEAAFWLGIAETNQLNQLDENQ